MKRSLNLLILAVTVVTIASATDYYCRYCGERYSSINSLTAGKCSRQPLVAYKGRHAPAR